ncbi:MAG: hypothetical protein HC767_03525 [Akkermansiaceae bacterium]|nr:hypothetical protein [Akkermansiaceae bacterium]
MSGASLSYPNSYSPAETGDMHEQMGTHMHDMHAYGENARDEEEGAFVCAGPCMPVMEWFSHALDVPDYVTYCSLPAHLRHAAHGVGLLLMLLPMALMRVTIPTISGDFYDAFIFVVASTLAPFAAAPLFGMAAPLSLQVVFAVVSCVGALSFVASGVCILRLHLLFRCSMPCGSAPDHILIRAQVCPLKELWHRARSRPMACALPCIDSALMQSHIRRALW